MLFGPLQGPKIAKRETFLLATQYTSGWGGENMDRNGCNQVRIRFMLVRRRAYNTIIKQGRPVH